MKKLEKMMQEGIETNDLKKVAWALNLGLSVEAEFKCGYSPLRYAADRDNIAIAKLLISAGADVDSKDYEDGMSPLHYAESVALAEYLISAGANVNAKDKDGESPLYRAAYWNDVALAEYLISAGADVNAKDNMGESPLHVTDSVALAELLISAGADVNAKDDEGESPLYRAVWWDNEEMQALLKRHGAVE